MSKPRPRRARKPKAPASKLDLLKAQAQQRDVPINLPTEGRAAHGDLELMPITETVFDRDRTGERKTGRKVVMGYALRDRLSEAQARLRRFRDLTDEQIAAGVRLERDWEAAGLEPRLVANLLGAGGGKGEGPQGAVIDARSRVHYALEALRLGGDEVVRVVAAVVIAGETSAQAGAPKYADVEKGRAHVAAILNVGLAVLAAHYTQNTTVRQTQQKVV